MTHKYCNTIISLVYLFIITLNIYSIITVNIFDHMVARK